METAKTQPASTQPTIAQLVDGFDFEYPIGTPILLAVTESMGYLLDRGYLQKRILAKNKIPKPGKNLNRYAWSRDDVVRVISFLDRKRRWDLTSPIHAHRFSQADKLRADKQNRQDTVRLNRWLAMDLVDLIAEMPGTEDERDRRIMAGLIITRIRENENEQTNPH